MAVSHVKSNTVADWTGTVTVGNSAGGTATVAATNLVRPGDWNSAHNQFYTLSGNTLVNSTASGTNVVLAGSGAISMVGSTASIVISSPVLSTAEPVPFVGNSTNLAAIGNATSSPISFWPFVVSHPLSAGIMDLALSVAFLTNGNSSGRQTASLHAGIYARAAGANSTHLTRLVSSAAEFAVTGNNSAYTISQATATGYAGYTNSTTASALSDISSAYTGVKKFGVPINSYLSPGQYYLAMMGTNSTSSINVGLSFSYFGQVNATAATAMAPIGSYSSAHSLGSNPVGGAWREGHGVWSSAGSVTGLPATINFASITRSDNSVFPAMRFWST